MDWPRTGASDRLLFKSSRPVDVQMETRRNWLAISRHTSNVTSLYAGFSQRMDLKHVWCFVWRLIGIIWTRPVLGPTPKNICATRSRPQGPTLRPRRCCGGKIKEGKIGTTYTTHAVSDSLNSLISVASREWLQFSPSIRWRPGDQGRGNVVCRMQM